MLKNTRVVITGRGGPKVLEVIEEELNPRAPALVRIRVLATGVAYADVLMRYGLYPIKGKIPFSPGYDVVGVVEGAPSSSGFADGDLVAALTVQGGYTQFVDLPPAELVPVPGNLDSAEAVSLVLNYITAYQMLHREAKLQCGNRILVHGAGGGVGTALLELGRLAGLEMFGTSSAGKAGIVESRGAVPIDYRKEDFLATITKAGRVDAVFDAVGGWSQWWRSYRSLRRGGRLVVYGISAAIANARADRLTAVTSFVGLGVMKLLPDGKTANFYTITNYKAEHPEWFREDLTKLFSLLQEKKIKPLVSERLPLREAVRAHELIESAAVSGKIVLLCQ